MRSTGWCTAAIYGTHLRISSDRKAAMKALAGVCLYDIQISGEYWTSLKYMLRRSDLQLLWMH